MMHVVQQWKVEVTFAGRSIVFWINEDHLANVLRQLASLQFAEKGLEQPIRLTIAAG